MANEEREHDASGHKLDRTINAVHDLADCAQARGLDVADELLTELLAVLYSRANAVQHIGLLTREKRSLKVLRLMCQSDAPDASSKRKVRPTHSVTRE